MYRMAMEGGTEGLPGGEIAYYQVNAAVWVSEGAQRVLPMSTSVSMKQCINQPTDRILSTTFATEE